MEALYVALAITGIGFLVFLTLWNGARLDVRFWKENCFGWKKKYLRTQVPKEEWGEALREKEDDQ